MLTVLISAVPARLWRCNGHLWERSAPDEDNAVHGCAASQCHSLASGRVRQRPKAVRSEAAAPTPRIPARVLCWHPVREQCHLGQEDGGRQLSGGGDCVRSVLQNQATHLRTVRHRLIHLCWSEILKKSNDEKFLSGVIPRCFELEDFDFFGLTYCGLISFLRCIYQCTDLFIQVKALTSHQY